MSYASATGAQRREVNSSAIALAAATQGARAGDNLPARSGWINPETVAARAAAALQAIGITAALPATQVVVTNAVKLSGVTITGTGTFFTPTVVGGVLTGGVLSAS